MNFTGPDTDHNDLTGVHFRQYEIPLRNSLDLDIRFCNSFCVDIDRTLLLIEFFSCSHLASDEIY